MKKENNTIMIVSSIIQKSEISIRKLIENIKIKMKFKEK